jgi:chromosome segregation ATPase
MSKVANWLRNAAPMILTRQRRPLRQAVRPTRLSTGDVQTTDRLPPNESATGTRLVAVRSEFERFSAALSGEIGKFAALHAKVEADHAQLSQRHEALTRDFMSTKEALTTAESLSSTLQGEQTRLRKDVSVLAGKLDATRGELGASQDLATHLRLRCETLETVRADLNAECDRRGVSLAVLRQERDDLSQGAEMVRVLIERGRQRKEDLAAQNAQQNALIGELQPQVENLQRKTSQDQEKIARLVAVLDAARLELELRAQQISDLQEEKNTLAAERRDLADELETNREASRAKLDTLTETNAALMTLTEKQRKQTDEQADRAARLEAANADLSQALQAASKAAKSAEMPHGDACAASAGRGKPRRRQHADMQESTLVTPKEPFADCAAPVDARF